MACSTNCERCPAGASGFGAGAAVSLVDAAVRVLVVVAVGVLTAAEGVGSGGTLSTGGSASVSSATLEGREVYCHNKKKKEQKKKAKQ